MPEFIIRAGTPEGEVVERRIESSSRESASEEVRRLGLHVLGIKRRGFSIREILPKKSRVVTTERFLLFNQELLALVKAGLPIVQSFDIMLERQKDPRFRKVLDEIRDKIKSGVALSDAFASYGKQFPPIYSSSLSFGMIFVMLTYVIPKFSEFYAGFGQELPLATRTMITLAFLVRTNIPYILIAVIASVVLTRRWAASSRGALVYDRLKLKIPLVGGILHRFAILQFTQSLGTLLSGGTPMVPSLEIASLSITNRFVSDKVAGIAQNVRQGEPLWHSLDTTRVMGDLAVEMIKVGESSGALVEMLGNVSEFYDEEIESNLARMISLIEPVILVGLGGVIAGLLYAFYLPLFELTKGAGAQ